MPSPTPAEPQDAKKDGPMQILREARGARETSERLLPLLDLLQEGQQEGGPLDELKDILESILLNQKHLMQVVEDLDRKFDALSGRARRSPSQASPEPPATHA